jgi:hypothetical protein
MRMKQYTISITLTLLTATALLTRAEPTRTDINPALTYYQAFNVVPELSKEDRDYVDTNEWRGQKLPDRLGQLLKGYDHTFELARQAAHSTAPCDWGIDWSPGPYTLLPHLSRIKAFAQTARLRVVWNLQQGRQTDARDDLLAAVALGRHGASDSSLISTLVQIAVERIACQTVAENFSRFSPETLQQIADGLTNPPARSTIADCMPLETAGFPNWIIARLKQLQAEHPGDDAKVLETISDVFTDSGDGGRTTNRWPQMVAASGGTTAGMINLIQDLLPLYSRLTEIEALPLPQYETQMKQFSADVENTANPFARELLPALEKCRPREFTIQAELAMVQAAVAYKLHGTAAFQSVADPAGQGPFTFQRFIFDGVDRGFELSSPYAGTGYQAVLILVETDGPPFVVDAKRAGQAVTQ